MTRLTIVGATIPTQDEVLRVLAKVVEDGPEADVTSYTVRASAYVPPGTVYAIRSEDGMFDGFALDGLKVRPDTE